MITLLLTFNGPLLTPCTWSSWVTHLIKLEYPLWPPQMSHTVMHSLGFLPNFPINIHNQPGLSHFQNGISYNPIHNFYNKHPWSIFCIIWVHLHYPPHPHPQLSHSTPTTTQLLASSHPNYNTSDTHKLYNYTILAILHFLTLLQINVVIYCSSST